VIPIYDASTYCLAEVLCNQLL